MRLSAHETTALRFH